MTESTRIFRRDNVLGSANFREDNKTVRLGLPLSVSFNGFWEIEQLGRRVADSDIWFSTHTDPAPIFRPGGRSRWTPIPGKLRWHYQFVLDRAIGTTPYCSASGREVPGIHHLLRRGESAPLLRSRQASQIQIIVAAYSASYATRQTRPFCESAT